MNEFPIQIVNDSSKQCAWVLSKSLLLTISELTANALLIDYLDS